VTTAALSKQVVMGAHGIAVLADRLLDEVEGQAFDAIVLPGGMPGSRHLRDDARVQKWIREQHQRGGVVAAICAAPMALEAAGILKGRRATAFPGTKLPSAEFSEARVVVDGHIVTSRGPGTTFEFALALLEILGEGPRVARLREGMLVSIPPSSGHE
jgi:protein deglycase